MALASTLVGRMMGASHAAGAHALAVGMIQAAIGGVMVGVASSMTQSTQSSSSSAAPQTATSSSTSSQPKVIQVGAAGRAQDAGTAAAAQPVQVEVKLALDSNGVINVVEKNIRSNGRLRVAVVNA
jgi:hypothetical protein